MVIANHVLVILFLIYQNVIFVNNVKTSGKQEITLDVCHFKFNYVKELHWRMEIANHVLETQFQIYQIVISVFHVEMHSVP